MAKLRRYALALWALACPLLQAKDVPATEGPIVLTVATDRSLLLHNTSQSLLHLQAEVLVEQADSAGNADRWKTVPLHSLLLRQHCGGPPPTTLALAPGARFQMLPWTGLYCAAQCASSCRAELRYPAGHYRYLLHTVQGLELPSPGFTLP